MNCRYHMLGLSWYEYEHGMDTTQNEDFWALHLIIKVIASQETTYNDTRVVPSTPPLIPAPQLSHPHSKSCQLFAEYFVVFNI